MDLSRRLWLRARYIEHDNAVRLPWLQHPLTFTDQCTRCGDCVAACPEAIIEIGDGGFPEVNFAVGECIFCGECGDNCPENLFVHQSDNQPWFYKATITENCFAKNQISCQSCQDACETQAIRFTPKIGSVSQPVIDPLDCNGCGACVSVCPALAIQVKLPQVNVNLTNPKQDANHV